MPYSISIKPEVADDLDQAINWYENQKEGLRMDLLIDFDKTINKIKSNPHFASFIRKDSRAASLKTFPYHIVYRIYENEKRINVIALSHHKQKPFWYKDRK